MRNLSKSAAKRIAIITYILELVTQDDLVLFFTSVRFFLSIETRSRSEQQCCGEAVLRRVHLRVH